MINDAMPRRRVQAAPDPEPEPDPEPATLQPEREPEPEREQERPAGSAQDMGETSSTATCGASCS